MGKSVKIEIHHVMWGLEKIKMAKPRLWSVRSLLTSLKAMAVSVVSFLPLLAIQLLVVLLIRAEITIGPILIGLLALFISLYGVFMLWFWGFLAGRFWGWK